MSDWGAVNDRVKGLKAGLDLEMPGDIGHNRQVLLDAIKNRKLTMEELDTAVRRVLNMINNTTMAEGEVPAKFEEHAELSKQLSVDSAVLLKNDNNILPLQDDLHYLVIGDMFEKMRYQGGCSSVGQSRGLWFLRSWVRAPSSTPKNRREVRSLAFFCCVWHKQGVSPKTTPLHLYILLYLYKRILHNLSLEQAVTNNTRNSCSERSILALHISQSDTNLQHWRHSS